MDHLGTNDERKERWYATHLTPRLVEVTPARTWEDLLLPLQGSRDVVWSVPFEWLAPLRDDPAAEEEGDDPNPTTAPAPAGAVVLRAALEAHGFVVISGVLDGPDCASALDLAWDWLEAASYAERKVASDAPSRLPLDTQPTAGQGTVRRADRQSLRSHFPQSVEGGIQPFYGSGHSTLAWFVRSHRNVRRVFASLHNASMEEPLLASLDGIILWPSTCEEGSGGEAPSINMDAGWFHVDQNPRHRPTRQGVQGLVNLLPVSRATGGNTLVAQSHRLFPSHYTSGDARGGAVGDFYRQRLMEVGTEDWLEIDPHDDKLLEPSKIIMLRLARGDVLLWDSRTVHCSYPPDRQCETDGTYAPNYKGLIRAATLVNMVPFGPDSNRDVMAARRDAATRMRTLTHWVSKAAPLGNERAEQVAMEELRVAAILEWESLQRKKVLLSFEDLSSYQQAMVVGFQGTTP